MLLVVLLVLGVVILGRGVWFDPRSATEESATSSEEASTTGSSESPPTTRRPGPMARIIQWLNAYAPLAGGASGLEDEAFGGLLAGDCQEVLQLASPGGGLGEPERSLYEGAAAACLAAFEDRPELWPRAEAAYARIGGQTSRLSCETRTVYPLLEQLLQAHRANPNVRLVKGSAGQPKTLRCPRFTKVTPTHGPAAGGYQVRIEGQHLPPVVGVNIDFSRHVEAPRQDGQQVVITMPPAPPPIPGLDPDGWVMLWPDGAVNWTPAAAVEFRYDPPAATTTTSSTTSTTEPVPTTSSTTPAPTSS